MTSSFSSWCLAQGVRILRGLSWTLLENQCTTTKRFLFNHFHLLCLVNLLFISLFLTIKKSSSKLTKMGDKLLSELNANSDLWKIVVRVMRKWNVYDKASPDEVFCFTMVLIDAKVCSFFFFNICA